MKIFLPTAFALLCFALNSILCRLALKAEEIDAASFTVIRLVSGAIALLVIYRFFGEKDEKDENGTNGNWFSAFFLFAYAVCFSFAYISLTTATGALILFGTVQFTMIAAALLRGERPRFLELCGLAAAFSGLIYLVFPGLSAPPFLGSVLMITAGIAWGFYTLSGKGSADPLGDTAGNFLRSCPFVIVVSLPFLFQIHLSAKGIWLAILSGAVTSGVGYTVWYAALKHLTATRAAILQLSVPAIAALGGVILLAENFSFRLVLAGGFILGGIGLAIFGRTAKS